MAEKQAFFQRLISKYIYNPLVLRGFKDISYPYNLIELGASDADENVSVKRGTKTSIAFSCINALAQDVAKLPFNVRRDTAKGKLVVKNNPVYKLIHNTPNSYTTSFNFWYECVFKMLSYGNAYYFITRDGNFQPADLLCLNPDDVTPVLINEGGKQEVIYEFKDNYISSRDILHFKMFSFDGIIGVSPIIWNASTFGYRLKQDKYKAKVLGTKPPGILTFTEQLNDVQTAQNKKMWKDMTQGEGLGGTPVLSGGAKYQPFMIPPNEGQMIEASELNDEDIAGIYRVPPTILQRYKRATFSNAEQQDLVYLKYSLTPLLKVIEQQCDRLFSESNKISSEPLYTKFNIKAMLRGDIKTQAEWYRMLRSFGLASANEIREMEDLPPLAGETGDMVLVQGAMIPLDQLKEFYSSKSPSDQSQRTLGFDIQTLKENIERLEIMNHDK